MIQKNQIINKTQQKFKEFSIYVDMSKVDRTWQQYGYLKAPLAIRKPDGELSSRSHKNEVLIYNDDFKKLLSKSYAVIPHEFVSDILQKYVLKNISDLKMSIHKEYEAHDGDSHYWTLLSDEKFQIDENDNWQFGVSIRNGIGTNVSLGADLYTMRIVCTNGAVTRGRNYGSFSIPHLGKVELIAKYFEKFIRQLFGRTQELKILYRKSKMIKVNDEIATQVYKHMPFAAYYLPSEWNVASRYEIKDLKNQGKYKEDMNLVNVTTKNQTLLEVFNTITEKQRDGLRTGRINFNAVSTHQIGLHNALVQIVNSNQRGH